MAPIKIALVSLGYMPHFIDFSRLEKWNSKVFRIVSYERIDLLPNTDGYSWSYSDASLEDKIPTSREADYTLAVVNARLDGNFYARRLQNNRIAISTNEIADILTTSDIPLENYILRMLYKYSISCKQYHRIPVTGEGFLSHDETRVCLFDMTPIKTDLVYSTERLGLCEECKANLKKSGVPASFLDVLEAEIKKIKKSTYYRIIGFIKRRPILAITISAISALLLNILSSILYDVFLAKLLR